jgi:hypothetical protein
MPTVATANGELYLFGGLVRETVRNDLYQFSSRELSAKYIQTGGEVPSPRVGHKAAIVSSVLIVWGGDTKGDSQAQPTDKQDDGLYLLNLGWSRLRYGHHRPLTCIRSLERVDKSDCVRSFTCWTLRACGHNGRITVLCVRWPSGWGIFERSMVFRPKLTYVIILITKWIIY